MEKSELVRIKRFWLIIGILAGIGLFFLVEYMKDQAIKTEFLSKVQPRFIGNVPTKTGLINLELYRREHAFRSLSIYGGDKVGGVMYKDKDFSTILEPAFDVFVRSHDTLKNCIWQMGVYPMVFRDTDHPNKIRLGVYFIPTMYDTSAKKVHDFYKEKDSAAVKKCYIKKKTISIQDDEIDDAGIIYDEGHLWP